MQLEEHGDKSLWFGIFKDRIVVDLVTTSS